MEITRSTGEGRSAQGETSIAEFSELLSCVYQGALETPPWAHGLELIRTKLQAVWVTLILRAPARDGRAPLLVHACEASHVVPGDWEASYNQHYFLLDPFVGLPADRVVTVDEVFGETGWLSSELYKQFLKPQGIRYILGADLRTPSGVECRFRVCRTSASTEYCASDKAICGLVLPHLKQAIELHSRLDVVGVEREVYANTVNRMQIGMITLDENGAIIDINSSAGEIIDQANGLCIVCDRIAASDAQENRRLKQLVRRAIAGYYEPASAIAEAMPISRGASASRLGLLVRTIPLSDWSGDNKRRPAVALFLRDPDRKPQGALAIIRKLFDLTPAEASLAFLLTNGLSLDEAANDAGISKNTARAHLRSIFSKTGVTRQATLVRLLLGSMVPIG
ncbi:helix-turn-helix transcriptional regulator [Paraburkholderia silviterrae]|uniref:Helix-turn-helix transcriptional regulator n=1 Tax=Paraburkholderia silviterrae TaxID=2528715 RepID=A0A4R5M377_9BURK|nr:LuxR C-terminal-related transcriptional regulator [Paraburkholderia silviterrae]TDG20081.1 helix-turn-helix transcriptional regulator [Paraburkholderia silviterrae]